MSPTAKKTNPQLWEKVKRHVTDGDKGGKPGQWSARKAQMAVQDYKHEGGGYEGGKSADNHLVEWQEENWGTESGEPSGKTGERYLPKEARDHLTKEEYRRTSDKKRRDTQQGHQHSAQPKDIAEKTAGARHHGDGRTDSKVDLYDRAKAKKHPWPLQDEQRAAEGGARILITTSVCERDAGSDRLRSNPAHRMTDFDRSRSKRRPARPCYTSRTAVRR